MEIKSYLKCTRNKILYGQEEEEKSPKAKKYLSYGKVHIHTELVKDLLIFVSHLLFINIYSLSGYLIWKT